MRSKKVGIVGIVIVSIIVLIAIFADFIIPYDANAIVGTPFQTPSANHILGTNDIGQDIFSEFIIGARYSLMVGFITMCISASIGIFIGMIAGWYGGIVDSILMKITSFVYVIPYLPLVIVLSVFLRGNIMTTAIVLGIASWPEMARVLRAQTMKIKKSDYITAIVAMGAPTAYVLTKHIVRELLPLIAYRLVARFKNAIIAESTLSFLGLSASTVKSWGTMLYYAQVKNAFLTDAWLWWVIPPGLMISLLAFGLMLISYSMEGKMDPRLEKAS